jgi:hypothetical protein
MASTAVPNMASMRAPLGIVAGCACLRKRIGQRKA